jgi:hypothetical protein
MRCFLQKESSQFDGPIENGRMRRMAVLVLFRLDEHEKSHAPYATVLGGFVELGRFLLHGASPE